MPVLGKGTEIVKLLLSQASKDMYEPLVPMLFPILGAHVKGVEFQYPDHTWKEMCGMMANLVADSGCNKGQLTGLVEATCRDFPIAQVADRYARTIPKPAPEGAGVRAHERGRTNQQASAPSGVKTCPRPPSWAEISTVVRIIPVGICKLHLKTFTMECAKPCLFRHKNFLDSFCDFKGKSYICKMRRSEFPRQ